MSIYKVLLILYALLLASIMVIGTKKTTLKHKTTPKKEKHRHESSGSKESLSSASSNEDARECAYLPGDISPMHYDIQYTFGMKVVSGKELKSWEGFHFYGVVSIKIKALNSTSEITLHAHDEYFTVDKKRTKVMDDETNLSISSIQQLKENYQLLTINLKKKLIKSKVYTIVIPFNGFLLSFGDLGMFLTRIESYTKKKHSRKIISEFNLVVASQPDGARRVFPCFDEPQYKATFSLTVGHHKDFSTVLSNMPLHRTLKKNPMEQYWTWNLMNKKFKLKLSDFSWEQFKKSPLMSTYLLAFSITNFTYIESPPGLTKTPIRIYTTKDSIHQAEHASQTAPKLLAYYEHYLNMSYHLPKLDIVVLSFELEAFESWGHITMDPADALYEPELDILNMKMFITSVISHEIAHQFFGNIVTPKSWDEIWLSEGFAKYFEINSIRDVGFPEFVPRVEDDVIFTWNFYDSNERSHALTTPVDPSDIMSYFTDSIEYTAGSLIVRMLHKYVGENVCRKILHKYLLKNSYGNVDKDDLWAAFDEDDEVKRILGKNVTMKNLMDSWVTVADYPVLTVTRNYGHNTLTLRQQPHSECKTKRGIDICKDKTKKNTSNKKIKELSSESCDEDDKTWWLPLDMLVQGKGNVTGIKKWLSDSEGVDTPFSMKHSAKDDKWVLFNAGLIAPYRVNYDAKNWKLLSKELQKSEQSSSIPNLSRQQLLKDGQNFGKLDSDDVAISSVGKILKNLTKMHFITHAASLNAFGHMNKKMARTPEYETYQRHMANLIRPTYDKLGGIQGDKQSCKQDILQQNLQMRVSAWSCQLRVPGCEEKALEMFRQWRQTKHPDEENPIPIHARHTSVCVALSHDAAANMEFVRERVRHSRSYAERRYLLAALACSKDKKILTRLLDWSVANKSEISTSDRSWLMMSIASKPSAFQAAKTFLYSRTADIISIFSRNRRLYFKDFIKSIIKNINTQKELEEFLKWRKDNEHLLEELDDMIDLTVNTASRNVEWMKSHKKQFVEQLRLPISEAKEL